MLRELKFIDSTGLTELVRYQQRHPDVAPVVLRHPTELVRKVLQVTGIDKMFTIDDGQ